MVYSANKITDPAVTSNVSPSYSLLFSFEHRIPYWLYQLADSFPWYTGNPLYWNFNASLMFLFAFMMAFAFGPLSRFACLGFFLCKLMLTFKTQTGYNNHEYLYATLALAMATVDAHDVQHSFLGQAAIVAFVPAQPTVVVETEATAVATAATGGGARAEDKKKEKSAPKTNTSATQSTVIACCYPWLALLWALTGTFYLCLNNAVHGIAGHVAMIGMFLFIYPAVLLLLGCAKDLPLLQGLQEPAAAAGFAPRWHFFFIKLFIGALYFFAGLAKMDADWLNGGTAVELLRRWTGPTAPSFLRESIVEGLLSGPSASLVLAPIVYGGVILDTFVAFALCSPWLTVRLLASLAAGAFHLTNHWLFLIESFPWVMFSTLCIFHDSAWIEYTGNGIRSVLIAITAPQVSEKASRFCFLASIPFAAIFIAIHLLVPVPCGIHNIGDDGSLVWGSSCQFFNWRMMTRSVTTYSAVFRFQDPRSGRTDVVAMKSRELGLSKEEGLPEEAINRMLFEVPMYEDRVSYIARDASERANPSSNDTNSLPGSPKVYADIWLEINGPPGQRYIDPSVDLTSSAHEIVHFGKNASLVEAIRSWPISILNFLTSRPQPLAKFVVPRIVQFRTHEWIVRYRRLLKERQDKCKAAAIRKAIKMGRNATEAEEAGNLAKTHLRVMFLADSSRYGALGLKTIFPNNKVEIQLLAGKVVSTKYPINTLGDKDGVSASGAKKRQEVVVGDCIEFEGMIGFQTIRGHSLWMLVLEQGLDSMAILGGNLGNLPPPLTLRSKAIDEKSYCIPNIEVATFSKGESSAGRMGEAEKGKKKTASNDGDL